MELFCPKCDLLIKPKDINYSKNTCFCNICNETYNIFDIVYKNEINEMIKYPPKGIRIKKEYGKLSINISLYDKVALPLLFLSIIGLLPFIGVVGSIILYKKLIYIIEWLPFLVISTIILRKIYFQIFGEIKIVFCERMYIFTGIGIFGNKKYINWDAVQKIYNISLPYDKDDIRKFLYIEEQKTNIIPLYYITDFKIEYLLFILRYCVNNKLETIIK